MNLIIDAGLSEPPSSISCFRDVTLWAKFKYDDILLCAEDGTREFYNKWLKKHGAMDFISYIMLPSEHENGFWIIQEGSSITPSVGIVVKHINAHNLQTIYSRI